MGDKLDKFDAQLKKKQQDTKIHTQDSLDSRYIKHQKTEMSQREATGWINIVRNFALSTMVIVGTAKTIFDTDIVNKLCDLLIKDDHITQFIISVLILGIYITKKWKQ